VVVTAPGPLQGDRLALAFPSEWPQYTRQLCRVFQQYLHAAESRFFEKRIVCIILFSQWMHGIHSGGTPSGIE